MITKADILKMARSVYKRSQGYPEVRLIHPHREWSRLLVASVFVLLLGMTYSGYTYIQFDAIESTVSVPTPKVVRYQENDINRALEQYSKRRDVYDALIVLPEPVVEVATSTEVGSSIASTTDTISVENASSTPATIESASSSEPTTATGEDVEATEDDFSELVSS